MPPGAQAGLLGQILGRMSVARQPEREPVDSRGPVFHPAHRSVGPPDRQTPQPPKGQSRFCPDPDDWPECRPVAESPVGQYHHVMLTARGWWLLAFVLMLLAMGAMIVRRGSPAVLVLGLSIAIWFAWEWLAFALQARFAVRKLRVRRNLSDDHGRASTFWAGRTGSVSLQAELDGLIPLAFVRFSDRPPAAATSCTGETAWSGSLSPKTPVEWQYRMHFPNPGSARFEGVRVQIADVQGFFYHETFLREPIIVPILPGLVNADARPRTQKLFNLLPPPGLHRHKRPGSGSELLDLRDYRPGDPPKRIAWKASARRDRLITREFESEVPIRCTLFVDASDSVRLGPPGRNLLANFVSTASAAAQGAAANRDLVGLAVCDERHIDYTAPARTPTHVIGMVRKLARLADLAPATEAADVEPLLGVAHELALSVYPDLMRPGLNRFPGWLAWLRPQPGWTIRRPTMRDRVFGSTFGAVAFVLLTLTAVLAGLGLVWLAAAMKSPAFAFCGLAIVASALLAATGLTARRRRKYAERKRLASLIGWRYGLPLGATGLILEEDAACSGWLQRFLADHQVAYDVPRYDELGRPLFARPAKAEVLARALTRAIRRGHDNELFVVLADLLDLDDSLTPLVNAVRVARARHHQVMIVCPARGISRRHSQLSDDLPPADASADELIQYALRARTDRAWQTVRRAFGRLGVPVVPAAENDTARLILHRLDQMRALQGARRA